MAKTVLLEPRQVQWALGRADSILKRDLGSGTPIPEAMRISRAAKVMGVDIQTFRRSMTSPAEEADSPAADTSDAPLETVEGEGTDIIQPPESGSDSRFSTTEKGPKKVPRAKDSGPRHSDLPGDKVLSDADMIQRSWRKYADAVAATIAAGQRVTVPNVAGHANVAPGIFAGFLLAQPLFAAQHHVEPWQ